MGMNILNYNGKGLYNMFDSIISLIFLLFAVFIIMFVGSTYKLFAFLLIPLEWVYKGGWMLIFCYYFIKYDRLKSRIRELKKQLQEQDKNKKND